MQQRQLADGMERRTSQPRHQLKPLVAELENRSLLSVTIQLDYRYDVGNFFNTQAKRDVMQLAADSLGSTLNDSLLAINPSGFNTWAADFPHPWTGQTISIPNLVVPADTLIIFVGGSNLSGGAEAGEGSTGGFSASGDSQWLNTVEARGQGGILVPPNQPKTDYANWGGAITFDNSGDTNWFFGRNLDGFNSSQTDFLSVAQHEVAHVLGLGTADSWRDKIAGGTFRGANAIAAYGGQPVPVNGQQDHWANSVRSDGIPALMTPVLTNGTRGLATSLDFAALRDVGWQVITSPPTLQFTATTYSSAELAGTSTITVTRSGGLSPATVHYATSNGTATAGLDYAATAGTLSFGQGESSKTFTITIFNDGIAEPTETVNLSLTSPTGGAVLGISTAVLRITDRGSGSLADFDSDGRSDLAVFRPGTAQWFARGSGEGRLLGNFGATNLFDIPVPGDYDGDGTADLAIFRPSTAEWFVRGPNGGRVIATFGTPNLFDIPVPGDYDGDGVTEPAVFRPSTAEWFAMGPNGTTRYLGVFGATNFFDIPVPGDYDGDGVSEPAIFRPSTAQWIARGTNGSRQLGTFGATNFFDLPTPGDYDGDGVTEPAIFRPSTAQWIARGTNGSRQLGSFGGPNGFDLPAQTSIGSLVRLGRTGSGISRSSVSAGIQTASLITMEPGTIPVGPLGIDPITAVSPTRRRRGSGDSSR